MGLLFSLRAKKSCDEVREPKGSRFFVPLGHCINHMGCLI